MVSKTFFVTVALALSLASHGASSMNTTGGFSPRSISPRMLSDTLSSTTGNDCYTAYFTWSATQNTQAMTSTVTAKFYVEKVKASSTKITGKGTYSVRLDDDNTFSSSKTITFNANAAIGATVIIWSGTVTIEHNSCGSASLSPSISYTSSSGSFSSFMMMKTDVRLDTIPVYATVTFDPDGGQASFTSKTVACGDSYGDLPTATREGYTFDGWYTGSGIYGNLVQSTSSSYHNSAHTLYAHWTPNNYTVKFVSNNNTVSEEEAPYGSDIAFPADPALEGHEFVCWCSDEEMLTQYTGTTVPAGNLTLYANFSVLQFTVEFNCGDDGVSCPPLTDDYETSFADFVPEKEGYTFEYWCTDADLEVRYHETVIPACNLVLYAKFVINKYTVKFNCSGDDDDGFSCPPFTGDYKTSFADYIPEKEGYTFDYWCLDELCETQYTELAIPSRNITLYAHWTPKKYTVKFNCSSCGSDEGITFPPFTGDYKTSFADYIPLREGYTFDYWCLDEVCETPYTEATVPSRNVTLYAHWVINKYKVIFECKRTPSCPIIIEDYETSFAGYIPEKEGHRFDYWCEDEACETEYTGTTVPSRNITLYAHWTVLEYTVVFVNEDGVVKEETLPYGTELTYPADPEKEGYVFDGWDPSPEMVGAGDVNITAKWVKITSDYVEIVFSKQGMTEEEIREILDKYASGSKYKVVSIESGDEGTTVIIKFNDASSIEEFSKSVRSSDDKNFSRISYSYDHDPSGAAVLLPSLLYFYL